MTTTELHSNHLSVHKKKLKSFVAILCTLEESLQRIELLGFVAKDQTLCLMDFTARTTARWDKELPKKKILSTELKKLLIHTQQQSAAFRAVENFVKKARYALKTGKYPESVKVYLKASKIKIPRDCKPAINLRKLYGEIEERMAIHIKKADKLESEKKFMAAISEYDEMRRLFPLPLMKRMVIYKQRELWTALRGYRN